MKKQIFEPRFPPSKFFFYSVYFYLFIWLHCVLVTAHGIFRCSMWDLGPQPGVKSRPPALAAQSLSHWTTREVSLLIS